MSTEMNVRAWFARSVSFMGILQIRHCWLHSNKLVNIAHVESHSFVYASHLPLWQGLTVDDVYAVSSASHT